MRRFELLARRDSPSWRHTHFTIWGTEVNSDTGWVGTPTHKRGSIALVEIILVAKGKTTKQIIRRWVALPIHPFMHKRRCMSALHRIFTWTNSLVDNQIVHIPSDIADEIWFAILLLGVCHGNITWLISNLFSATDATPPSGGATIAPISTELAHSLYAMAEYRGEYVRLDWSPDWPASEMRPLRPSSRK